MNNITYIPLKEWPYEPIVSYVLVECDNIHIRKLNIGNTLGSHIGIYQLVNQTREWLMLHKPLSDNAIHTVNIHMSHFELGTATLHANFICNLN